MRELTARDGEGRRAPFLQSSSEAKNNARLPLARKTAPAEPVSRRTGDASRTVAYNSRLDRDTLLRVDGAGDYLLSLQRQYGNRYVQRVLSPEKAPGGEVSSDLEQTILKGGGQAMDRSVTAQMESAFGADFGDVRVHVDSEADRLNRGLNARAFAYGKDIYFRRGEYSPGSSTGRTLIAHELTHVVQQTEDTSDGKPTLGRSEDPREEQANDAARAVVDLEQHPAPDEGRFGWPRGQVGEGAVKEAQVSHHSLQDLIARPRAFDPSDRSRQITSNVTNEENGILVKSHRHSPSLPGISSAAHSFRAVPRVRGGTIIRRQGWEAAGVVLAAASFAATLIPAGSGGFHLTNVQFRYTRAQPGPHPVRERVYYIFHLSSIKGLGASFAFLRLTLRYDGHNIISAYTSQNMVSGYEGGMLGSEAEVSFAAVQSSSPTEPVTEAYLLFEGFNNPSGPGFQRFTGRIKVNGAGDVVPDRASLTTGDGFARRWLDGFSIGWD